MIRRVSTLLIVASALLAAPGVAASADPDKACAQEAASHGGTVLLDLRSGGRRAERTVVVDGGRLVDAPPATDMVRVVCAVDGATFDALVEGSDARSRVPWLVFVGSFGVLAVAIFGVAASGRGVGPAPTLAREEPGPGAQLDH